MIDIRVSRSYVVGDSDEPTVDARLRTVVLDREADGDMLRGTVDAMLEGVGVVTAEALERRAVVTDEEHADHAGIGQRIGDDGPRPVYFKRIGVLHCGSQRAFVVLDDPNLHLTLSGGLQVFALVEQPESVASA